MSVDWDSIEPEFTGGRVYAGGFDKPCGNCGKPFTARSARDRYCFECSHSSTHLSRREKNGKRAYQFYTGLGGFKDSEYVYYHAQIGAEYLHTDHGIQWHEWLDFMYGQYRRDEIVMTWGGKYHWACILRGLPAHRGHKLMDADYGYGGGTRKFPEPYPVDTEAHESPDGRRWLIRLFYNERVLEFQPKTCDCRRTECDHTSGKWMRVQDAYQWFECPLADLIESDATLGTDGQRTIIAAGNELTSADARMPESIAAQYSAALNKLAAEVMERKRTALARADVRLLRNKEYGIGCAASQIMESHGIPHRRKRGLPAELMRAGVASYFGPWMEDVACGYVEGESHEYDLNSAFGSILAGMPCLMHGWSHGQGRPDVLRPGHLRLEHVYVRGPGDVPFGPAMHREFTGHVLSPVETSGWHWNHELAERSESGLIADWTTDEWWEKEPCDCEPPFAWVRDLFGLRMEYLKAYGKGSVEERLFRLLPDAIYGKLAESGEYATFANPLYASYVTSMCRALVLRAIRSHQDGIHGVIKVMSDSFVTRNAHNRPNALPIGNGLGQWKVKIHTGVTVFAANGLWWSDETQKTSGIKPADMAVLRDGADAVFRSWDKALPGIMNEFPVITMPIGIRITTLTQAARTSWNRAGLVETNTTETRRYDPGRYRDAMQIYYDDEFGFFRSYPLAKGESGIESAPYRRHADWKDDDDMMGYNQNGPVLAKVRKALGR